MNSKWNLLFDIYDPISKWNYLSLMSVFLNHKKVQFKERNPLIYNINIDILDLSHALCACNEALFYFLFISVHGSHNSMLNKPLAWSDDN